MPLQERLDALLQQSTDPDAWRTTATRGRYTLACSRGTADRFLLRSSFVLDVPSDLVIDYLRPEAMFRLFHSRNSIAEASIVKSFEPGDVIGWIKFNVSGCPLQPVLKAAGLWNDGMVSYFRAFLRRGLPRAPDAAAVVAMPLDIERMVPSESPSALHQVKAFIVEPLGGGAGTRLTEIQEIPNRYWWLRHLISRMTYAPEDIELLAQQDQLQIYREMSGFIVLRLRKCLRGPPLVPVSAAGSNEDQEQRLVWDATLQGTDFYLAEYLRLLLCFCGLGHIEVFDRLDGHSLVYYEAAARRVDWAQAWEVAGPLFRMQRSAYRRRYGGSVAPVLELDVVPRLCTLRAREVAQMVQTEPSEAALEEPDLWSWGPVSVRKTFVDFSCPFSSVETCSAP